VSGGKRALGAAGCRVAIESAGDDPIPAAAIGVFEIESVVSDRNDHLPGSKNSAAQNCVLFNIKVETQHAASQQKGG